MNYVYLDSKYNEYYVGDEAYAQIVAIVAANKYCMYDHRNRHPYTTDNPCIGKNICLEHVLQKQRNLTRLEIIGVADNNKSTYYFTDEQGYVYTSTEDSSEEARKDVIETLSYYGFTPPKTVAARGKMVNFYSQFLIHYLSYQLALMMMILTTSSSLSKKCSSTPEPIVYFASFCSTRSHTVAEFVLLRDQS